MEDLCSSIADSFNYNSTGCSVNIYALSSPPCPDNQVVPNATRVDRTDRLILVSLLPEHTTSTSAEKPNNGMFVFGLALSEYIVTRDTAREALIYVEKIDTSGYSPNKDEVEKGFRPPSISRAVVLGYLRYAQQTIQAETVAVHLFARAQPAYLFCGSEQNTRKNTLSDRSLLKWWMKVLGTLTPLSPTRTDPLAAFLYVPGEDQTSMRDVWTVGQASQSVKWTWGLAARDSARAVAVMPRFPDDARTKVLAEYSDATTTVGDVKELLALTGECRGRVSGFFSVKVKEAEDAQSDSSPALLPALESRTEFDALQRQLMKLDFGTREAALISSRNLEMELDAMAAPWAVIGAVAGDTSIQATHPPSHNSLSINNAQSMVKRKPGSVQSLVKPVSTENVVDKVPHTVQNLVKRKSTTNSGPGIGAKSQQALTTSEDPGQDNTQPLKRPNNDAILSEGNKKPKP
ncbi:histone acetylation protein-domain-containing protein [Powellomyces hirtus]|nr:histone acetylation protein-domain-containing protein [Powellomyces hirtus]